MLNRLFLLLHLIGALSLLLVSATTYETDDAIIVEGKFNITVFFTNNTNNFSFFLRFFATVLIE